MYGRCHVAPAIRSSSRFPVCIQNIVPVHPDDPATVISHHQLVLGHGEHVVAAIACQMRHLCFRPSLHSERPYGNHAPGTRPAGPCAALCQLPYAQGQTAVSRHPIDQIRGDRPAAAAVVQRHQYDRSPFNGIAVRLTFLAQQSVHENTFFFPILHDCAPLPGKNIFRDATPLSDKKSFENAQCVASFPPGMEHPPPGSPRRHAMKTMQSGDPFTGSGTTA